MTPYRSYLFVDALKHKKQLEDALKLVKAVYFQTVDECHAGVLLQVIWILEGMITAVEEETEVTY